MARSRKEHREAGLPAPKPKRAQNRRPYARASRAEDGTDDDKPLVLKPLTKSPVGQAQAAAKAAAAKAAVARPSQRQAATKKQKGKRSVAEAKLDF